MEKNGETRRETKNKWGDEMQDQKNGVNRQRQKNGETRRKTKKKWADKTGDKNNWGDETQDKKMGG